ncbi:MAG TPA: metallophosphoesterase family protein, partial [Rummeliibacillus sp.]|nr:metallophosphoesterase family protein [Rummeliibacillus sp.]
MKILVMSDTHSDAAVITQVIGQNPDVDAVFHCGDSELAYTAT